MAKRGINSGTACMVNPDNQTEIWFFGPSRDEAHVGADFYYEDYGEAIELAALTARAVSRDHHVDALVTAAREMIAARNSGKPPAVRMWDALHKALKPLED